MHHFSNWILFSNFKSNVKAYSNSRLMFLQYRMLQDLLYDDPFLLLFRDLSCL